MLEFFFSEQSEEFERKNLQKLNGAAEGISFSELITIFSNKIGLNLPLVKGQSLYTVNVTNVFINMIHPT